MNYPNYKKYNKAIWLPKLDYKVALRRPGVFTHHIKNYLHKHDHKHNFDYREINADKLVDGEVVEIETIPWGRDAELVYKLVVRTHLNEDQDLVVVVGLEEGRNRFITAWINDKTDKHRSLRTYDIEKTPSRNAFIL